MNRVFLWFASAAVVLTIISVYLFSSMLPMQTQQPVVQQTYSAKSNVESSSSTRVDEVSSSVNTKKEGVIVSSESSKPTETTSHLVQPRFYDTVITESDKKESQPLQRVLSDLALDNSSRKYNYILTVGEFAYILKNNVIKIPSIDKIINFTYDLEKQRLDIYVKAKQGVSKETVDAYVAGFIKTELTDLVFRSQFFDFDWIKDKKAINVHIEY